MNFLKWKFPFITYIFNCDGSPKTDCTAELPFTSPGVERTELAIGPEFLLIQSMPCSVTKLVQFVSSHLGNDI